MKFLKLNLMLLAVASFVCQASAQIDIFDSTRTLVLDAQRSITNASSSLVTNTIADTHGFIGTAKIDFLVLTNSAGGTLSVAIQGSADLTNWTSLTSVAYGINATVVYTNTFYGNITNTIATNSYILPGTLTTPTAFSSGFASTYLLPAPFTNTASALNLTPNGAYQVGYSVEDAPRYLRLVYNTGGTVTNITVSAIFTGRRSSEVK